MIVRDAEGRVLLQRRAHTSFMNGYYDFPSGHVDAGEGFATSAVRELHEETSLRTDESSLRLKHLNLNHTDFPYINAVFDVEKWEGTPHVMEPDKCDDMRFFPLDALPEKCTLAVRYIERAGFDTSGKTSFIDEAEFKRLIGVDASELTRP
jgi:8-oxo-dGTP pyrophosphatase MutT (NUDIX family)